jgi:transcriptional regulator with XRE-family HTH domain
MKCKHAEIMKYNATILGCNIRELRKKSNITLEDLGHHTGRSKSHIHQVESGLIVSPGVYLIYEIALFFGVTVEYLLENN